MVPTALSPRRSTSGVHAVFCLVVVLVSTGCLPRHAAAPDPDHTLGNAAAGHVASGPLRGRTGAYLTVGNAASLVDVRLADLPGLLYRISTPPDGGLTPQVDGPDGHPRVRLRPTGDDGPDIVTILLNRTVRWDIALPAGAGEQHLDLRAGRLARVRLGAAGLVDLRLPRPRGPVPITLSGPIGSLVLAMPPRTPVRLWLRAGATRARVPWAAAREVLPGETLVRPGWAESDDRYAVDAQATITDLTAGS
jgi:hypothetical protein